MRLHVCVPTKFDSIEDVVERNWAWTKTSDENDDKCLSNVETEQAPHILHDNGKALGFYFVW